MVGKGLGWREAVIAEEPDDLVKVPQPRLRGVHFPVVDCGFVNPELLSYLGLEEAEVKPTFAEVVAYRNELSWIGLRLWFGRHPPQMAKGQ